MLGSGQTSDLSGLRGRTRTMEGQQGPNWCILPTCTVPSCQCRLIAMHCTASARAASEPAPNPLMPMGACHHPGLQCAWDPTTNNIRAPEIPRIVQSGGETFQRGFINWLKVSAEGWLYNLMRKFPEKLFPTIILLGIPHLCSDNPSLKSQPKSTTSRTFDTS